MKFNNSYLPLFFFCGALLYAPLIMLTNGKHCKEKADTKAGIGKHHNAVKQTVKVSDTCSSDSTLFSDYFMINTLPY
ncbi:hypothetical protein [Pedobacter alluvionis]|uniref:Uncharacterized protein n=1 Tax=Pedobacter alluvionis TaxID=475253 RepID=A0A497XT63_9SPHI|nr:hypothetical protein [Pedobacter alluvionis]RLJ72640.1 hypothetical protein BCL90_4271 [Pedobacter alluvionis]TFB28050.1 hypothetical protein E3V97_23760 [Pedobacter alluvionis]